MFECTEAPLQTQKLFNIMKKTFSENNSYNCILS